METGIKFLISQCQSYDLQLKNTNKAIIIPVFSFINKMITSLKEYTAKPHLETWAEFIVHYHQNNQQMTNIICSWQKHKNNSLETHLLGTLLNIQDLSKLNTFLKLRKQVVKVGSNKMLDDILLHHEDVIGVVHSVYRSPKIKKKIIDGIKKLFISFKQTQAKIYSCVFIEFALSLHDEVYDEEVNEAHVSQKNIISTIKQDFTSQKQIIYDENLSKFHSSIHEDNGLYRKLVPNSTKSQCFSIIERKFLPNERSKERDYKSKELKSKILNDSFETLKSSEEDKRKIKYHANQYVTPQKFTNSYIYESVPQENQENMKRVNTLFELKRIEEEKTDREEYEKEGGYSTWVKMVNNNRQFKEKMLNSKFQENSHVSSNSINVIHDSIVKNSRSFTMKI